MLKEETLANRGLPWVVDPARGKAEPGDASFCGRIFFFFIEVTLVYNTYKFPIQYYHLVSVYTRVLPSPKVSSPPSPHI